MPFKEGQSGNPNGRKKDTPEQKRVKNIIKRIEGSRDKEITEDLIARNEIRYLLLKYGLSPFEDVLENHSNDEKIGFDKVITSLFIGATVPSKGQGKMMEILLKMSGALIDRVDQTSNGETVSNNLKVIFVKPDSEEVTENE